MPRLSLPLLCFGIILVQLDEGRFITKARPKKYDCSVEKYSRENALQTSGKSEEGEVANWRKGQMPLCSRTQWSFESLADQNSEFLCWRFQFCAQLTPSNEKYWQKGTRKFYSQAIWPSFSRPSTQEGRGTWLGLTQSKVFINCFQNKLYYGKWPEMWWNRKYINGWAISDQFMMVLNTPFVIPTKKN